MRSALNKDLEALSRVYAERGKQISQQSQTGRNMAFLLTFLGGLTLVVVGFGVLIISHSVAQPLSAITATIKLVAEGDENVEVPHANRGDEIGRAGAGDPDFQQAMEGNRNLNSQVLQDAKAREERAKHIEASVEEFRGAIGDVLRAVTDNATAMRETAQSITGAASDANGDGPPPPPPATQQASSNVKRSGERGRRAVGVGQEIGRQVRNPRVSSNRPASGPRSRSPKSKASPRRPSASTACSI